MSSREAPKRPRTCPPDETTQVIRPDCCYHCLTRGGNAAYECAKEGGEDRCTRCIRDKRAKCRLPTAQEEINIAARCPRCAKRGFKQCNGGNPCDTCIRNKTEGMCQVTSKERGQSDTKFTEVTSGSVTSNTVTRTDKAHTSRSTRRKSKQKVLDTSKLAHSKKPLGASRPIRARLTKRNELYEHESEAEENSVRYGIPGSPVHKGIFSEGDLQVLIKIEELANQSSADASSASHPVAHAATERSQTRPLQISGRKRKATQSELTWPSTPRSFARPFKIAGGPNIASTSPTPAKVPIRDRDGATNCPSGNVDIDMKEGIESHQVDSSSNNRRPRRSQGRVSYVEIPVDAETDHGRSIEDDSDSDVYIASTTDEEFDEDVDDEEEEEEEGEGEGEDASLIDELEHCMIVDGNIGTLEATLSDDCDGNTEDKFMELLTNRFKKNKTKAAPKPKAGKGIDFSLPPLDNVKDCFSDLAAKALSHGFGAALSKLGTTTLKVATMCSGTESPLLALNEISRGQSHTCQEST